MFTNFTNFGTCYPLNIKPGACHGDTAPLSFDLGTGLISWSASCPKETHGNHLIECCGAPELVWTF